MVIYAEDGGAGYDIMVKNCYAYDSRNFERANKIRLLNDSSRTDSDSLVKTSIKRDLSLEYNIVETADVASELLACRLPAWYLPIQRTCIAGL